MELNMNVSTKAKERFCEDCKIPIRLFQEPYFSDRIKLFDKFYGTVGLWNRFITELQKYDCEQDYFNECNRIQDATIDEIKTSEAYQRFNTEDMNRFSVTHKNLPGKDILDPTNDGKLFISVDMRKANFSSLRLYDKAMFGGADTWEQFISRFTKNGHIINSKYIRQAILGKCNPKRHITYEKYIMDSTLSILDDIVAEESLVFFSNDEIVYNVTDCLAPNLTKNIIEEKLDAESVVPFRVELFSLHKIGGTDGYFKKIYKNDYSYDIEFKCLDNYMMPFVLRYFSGQDVTDSDKVFFHEGLLAKFIDVPEIEVDL